MDIISRILEIMNSKGIRATQLTSDLGLSKNVVSEWKRGRIKPSIEIIIKLAKYFNTSTDYILTGNEFKEGKDLTENELELLHVFSNFSEREQLKIIGQLENELKHNKKSPEAVPEIQQYDIQMAAFGGGTTSQHVNMTPEEYKEWIEDLKKDAE